MNWVDNRKRIKCIEFSIIILAILSTFFGIICDFLVSKGNVIIRVAELSVFSLTLLQIQATITTLTLTIIALLSGNISDSYMGIPISKFYLEIRPYMLKQKIVICVEFFELLFCVLCQILAFYNTMIASFVSSMFIILVSIFNTYSIFRGVRNTLDEIEYYIYYQISVGKNCVNIGEQLVYDWKKIVSYQSTEEFDKYMEFFTKTINAILTYEGMTEDINSLSESMSLFLLTHDSKNCRTKGIRFIENFYYDIWIWIDNNQEKAKKIMNPISLIARVDDEWYRALDSIEAEKVEEELDWMRFSESIIRVASWIGFSNDNKSGEVSAVNKIARAVGRYLEKQNKKGNIVNSKYWQRILTDKYGCLVYGIPKESEQFYQESLALRDYNITYGFLLSGQLSLIKNGFFLDGIGNTYKIENESFVLKVMLIHCFMYYLAFRESKDCIDEKLQQQIKNLIVDNAVVKSIANFYYRLSENSDIFTERLLDKMERILDKYELFPIHSDFKTMIIDSVIQDYYLYVTLIIYRYSFRRMDLGTLLNTQKYYCYLGEPSYIELQKRFAEMYQIFNIEKSNRDVDLAKSDEILLPFVEVMKEKYRTSIINEAIEVQQEYECNNTKLTVESIIKKNIEKELEKFSIFNKPCSHAKTYKKVCIFRAIEDTRWICESQNENRVKVISANIVGWIAHELLSDFGMDLVNRNQSFDSDESFREYLDQHDYCILLGSQFVFNCVDYGEYQKHSEFLDKQNCIFVNGCDRGVAFRKDSLYISFKNIDVNILSPNIEEIEFDIYKDVNHYKYSALPGVDFDFEEDEIRNFIHNKYKKIEIFANITLGLANKKKDTGVIVVRKIDNKTFGKK